ncbi:metallopeptidase family protein [Actinomyces sp. B33]|uniref:metallopeptidase family protein n=1 Tax=Actinomyces sp. B33 TaxID=2942131 RepID=UPI00234108C1|nr:metallopeptidase family protein [Actinomyces sp. B33]MDC4232785.1 metallopeptidase family protein [Actinomyces sp. B33]
MPVEMNREEFESLVADALDEIPEEFWEQVDNLVVLVEDDPPADMEPDLLGLYDGVALTERDDYAGVLPDRILVFRNPTLAMCRDAREVAEEVRITVLHEFGHYFGIDDEQLHEMGWA